jgi:hypothetical protein
MTDFRNPRNNGQSLPPSFGGSISGLVIKTGSGSSNKKDTAGNLSAEVSGRTKTGVTGKASINASGNINKSGTGGGGSLGLGVGYENKKFKVEAEAGMSGSFFVPGKDLKDYGLSNDFNITDPQLNKLTATLKDVLGINAQDELSVSVTPRNNFKDGVDGFMVRYKLKF